jgi:hypothetical protein
MAIALNLAQSDVAERAIALESGQPHLGTVATSLEAQHRNHLIAPAVVKMGTPQAHPVAQRPSAHVNWQQSK